MIASRDPQVNLAQLGAMADQLDRYLDSDDLSRRLVVEMPGRRLTATMTLGVMLHLIGALERAAPNLLPGEREDLADLIIRFEATRAKRPKDYGEKLRRELKSLLDSWGWFLDDCARGEDTCYDNYKDEVWLRSRIHEVLRHAVDLGLDVNEAVERAAALDRQLDGLFQFGGYIGPPGEELVFPRAEYWWLYGRPFREDDYY